MNSMPYRAGAVKFSFWFTEFKTFMKLLKEGNNFEDIKALSEKENIFLASSCERAKQIYSTVKLRIKSLGVSSIDLFPELDIANQKILNLISIMLTDRFFFEFLHEVYYDRILIGTKVISDADFRTFFKNKQSQNSTVAEWTDATFNNLRKTYLLYLSEAGLLERGQGRRKIMIPIIDGRLAMWLKENNKQAFSNILTGVRE